MLENFHERAEVLIRYYRHLVAKNLTEWEETIGIYSKSSLQYTLVNRHGLVSLKILSKLILK